MNFIDMPEVDCEIQGEIKNGSKVFGLINWEDGVAVNLYVGEDKGWEPAPEHHFSQVKLEVSGRWSGCMALALLGEVHVRDVT